jgi:competence protein ComEA
MSGNAPAGTDWFALSRRELLVLAVGAGLVLGAIALVRGAEAIWGAAPVTVSGTGEALPLPARINLNTAEAHELTMLPGIGEKTARAIVEYRRAHGPFQSFDQLQQVRGIGPATVEAIRPHAMCAPVPPKPSEE